MSDGKVVPQTERTLEDAITYRIADELITSQYVNGPDASVVLALAHECYLKIADLLHAPVAGVGGEDNVSDIDFAIQVWSMRPPPGTETGKAWVDGCKQGYEWGQKFSVRAAAALERQPTPLIVTGGDDVRPYHSSSIHWEDRFTKLIETRDAGEYSVLWDVQLTMEQARIASAGFKIGWTKRQWNEYCDAHSIPRPATIVGALERQGAKGGAMIPVSRKLLDSIGTMIYDLMLNNTDETREVLYMRGDKLMNCLRYLLSLDPAAPPLAQPEAVAQERRYVWAVNELLACDYGDNESGRVGWRVYGWRDRSGERRIYGDSMREAIDQFLVEHPKIAARIDKVIAENSDAYLAQPAEKQR